MRLQRLAICGVEKLSSREYSKAVALGEVGGDLKVRHNDQSERVKVGSSP